VWLSDFGLSFDLTAEERHTPDGEVVGPRVFIAPELSPVHISGLAVISPC
jgi:hypothetical protein